MYSLRERCCGLMYPYAKILSFTVAVLFSLTTYQSANAQILIAGTTFDPSPGNGGRYYIGANDILQYGLQTGTITIVPPLAPDVDPGNFHATHQYAITDNPIKLDSAQYVDNAADLDYQLIISPSTSTVNVLQYQVTGLEPGTPVEVVVEYCHVIETGSGCNPWDVLSHRGNINPQNTGDPNQGTESPQLQNNGGNCGTMTWTTTDPNNGPLRHADANGNATFSLNTMQNNTCRPFAIRSIEIYGTPQPNILSAQGNEVCAGEQITLQSNLSYNGSYQWQEWNGSAWVNIPGGTNPAQLYEVTAVGTYDFRLELTPSGGGGPIYSDPITVEAITCCTINGNPASRQTIYLDDFGRIDLSDPTGNTFLVWDYSDVLNPVEVPVAADAPFRRTLTPAPLGATFRATGPPNDGEYCVAGYLTGYNFPVNGYDGARLEWANRVTGPTTIPNPDLAYDHSGQAEGAALFLNCPPNTGGDVLYSRVINNLCFGKQLFFECWIAVFTNSASGAYNPVDVSIRLTDGGNPGNVVTVSGTATRQADGGGVWVRLGSQITLVGNSVTMEIINNEDVDQNGNDLVVDDIRIMACAPPPVDVFFDLATLTTQDAVCEDDPLDLFTQPSTLLSAFFGGSPLYLYQWSTTPNDVTSWQNIGTPQSATQLTIPDPSTHPAFSGLTDGDNVYFRVIAASNTIYSSTNNFTAPDYANINDPCKNYAVSEPIEALLQCPLPVNLLSFTGVKSGNVNKLFWSTASEEDNAFFVVERSLPTGQAGSNGKDFTAIGQVLGNGTTTTTQQYAFDDASPATGINYYRLKQVDLDGDYTYSKVISLNSDGVSTSEMIIYPNPNSGSFAINVISPDEASYSLDIIDVQGKTVYTASGSGVTLEINDLPVGFYIARLHVEGEVITKKVVVH